MKKYLKSAKLELFLSNLLSVINVICVSYYPFLLSYVVDHFHSLGRRELFEIIFTFILSIVLILITSYYNKLVKAKYEKNICRAIRRDVFINILKMGYARFHSEKHDKYTSFLINDIGQLYTLFFENLIYLVNTITMLAAYTVILAVINWQMCLVIMGSLILILFVPQLVGKKYDLLNDALSAGRADYLSRSEEILSAHDLVCADNLDNLCTLYDSQLDEMQTKNYRLAKYRSFVQIFSGSTLYVQLILCFAVGLALTFYHVISLGVFASSLLYVEYIAQSSCSIVDEFLEIKSSKSYRKRCCEFLRADSAGKAENGEKFQRLLLDSVSYEIEGRQILSNVSLEFLRGKKYLIIGGNGSGKSTLLRMLAGITQPSGGRLLYNNSPAYNFDEIGYIPQKRYVFEGTLLENITLFAAECPAGGRERIAELCAMVNLNYPLDHRIVRNGENLSGGEIAKICLVRELYRNKDVLFIDEPLNDVDDRSEKDILDFLTGLDKTVVVVSHGLPTSAFRKFDEIITVQNGSMEVTEPK